jgi:hypothetical protein
MSQCVRSKVVLMDTNNGEMISCDTETKRNSYG